MPRTEKLFMIGRSQAVRLPAEFRFAGKEVLVERKGDKIVLSPRLQNWDDFFAKRDVVPANFLADRDGWT